MSADLHQLGVAGLAKALATREVSAVEAARHFLQRIDAHQALGAFVAIDADVTLAQARAADARIAQGNAPALAGVPIAHKDIFVTTDFPTTAGSRMLAGYRSPFDATVVRLLLLPATMQLMGRWNWWTPLMKLPSQARDSADPEVDILRQIGLELVKHRHTHPADDLATALAGAKYDAQFMSDDEITSVMMLLSVAGNDTTKQTTTSTVLALDRNPGEKAWLLADLEGRIVKSVDEFIRHASPVIQFSRTATRNVELGGQSISTGDKVAIFYCSGNRDEDAFEEPEKFILDRRPMPHLGFGGGGVHFCLGNGIAKVQLRAIFSEIYTLLPRLEVVAEPEYLCSEEFHGINRLLVNTH